MRIIVKVGTQAILAPDGTLLETVMTSLVAQLVELKKAGHLVVLVTSGAVASGRRVAREMLHQEFESSVDDKQLLASLGQHMLLGAYSNWFKPFGIATAQILLTKQDFLTPEHTSNIERLVSGLLEVEKIIPIINENDSVATAELMFTDNDELAGLIAAQIQADQLIILGSIAGVLDGSPEDPRSQVIPELTLGVTPWPQIETSKTTHGRGGMVSKLETAKKMAGLEIMTHIASIHESNILHRLIAGERVGTTIQGPAHAKG